MRTKALILGAVVCLVLCATAGQAKTTKTVQVDCTKGDSINGALQEKADELIIEISGMCQEKVVVERKNVTLRGADPLADGITGPALDLDDPNDRALVTVKDGGVRFEKLTITGSELRGLELTGSLVDIEDCRIVDNAFRGLQADGPLGAAVVNTEISDNGNWQVLTYGEASISCENCTVSGTSRGVRAWAGGRVFLQGSTIDVTGTALYAVENGYIVAHPLDDVATDITSDSWAAIASQNSQIWLIGGEIWGSVAADWKSMMWLLVVTQTGSPEGENLFSKDSSLRLDGSTLIGQTRLTGFSNGTAEGGSVLGALVCEKGADLYCDASLASSSSCGLCPVH